MNIITTITNPLPCAHPETPERGQPASALVAVGGSMNPGRGSAIKLSGIVWRWH